MITSNVLQRVFRLRAGEICGTGFAIPWRGRTYMVTAKHIFEGSPIDKFDLFRRQSWDTISIRVFISSTYDVAIIRLPENFQPGGTVIVDAAGIYLSEDVYMLGYPLDHFHDTSMGPPSLNNDFPLPLVSKGCLASVPGTGSPVDGGMMISGQIDQGFSGGPIVVVKDRNSPMLIGVISHNLHQKVREIFEDGHKMWIFHPANLVIGHSILVVTNLIDKHFPPLEACDLEDRT